MCCLSKLKIKINFPDNSSQQRKEENLWENFARLFYALKGGTDTAEEAAVNLESAQERGGAGVGMVTAHTQVEL